MVKTLGHGDLGGEAGREEVGAKIEAERRRGEGGEVGRVG